MDFCGLIGVISVMGGISVIGDFYSSCKTYNSYSAYFFAEITALRGEKMRKFWWLIISELAAGG